jgi:hypothetical protein
MQGVERRVFLDDKERLTAFLNRAEEKSEGFILIAQRSPGRRHIKLRETRRFGRAL